MINYDIENLMHHFKNETRLYYHENDFQEMSTIPRLFPRPENHVDTQQQDLNPVSKSTVMEIEGCWKYHVNFQLFEPSL